MPIKNYNYQNFDFTSVSDSTLRIIVVGIILGIIVGTVCAVLYKSLTHSFIKAMIKSGATDKDNAKRIDDLDLSGKLYIKSELKYPYKTLRRYVLCANEEELSAESANSKRKEPKGLPMDKARFYLPEENRIKAELRFTEVKRPVASIILTTVIGAAAAYFAIFVIPELLQMLDNFLTSIQ